MFDGDIILLEEMPVDSRAAVWILAGKSPADAMAMGPRRGAHSVLRSFWDYMHHHV